MLPESWCLGRGGTMLVSRGAKAACVELGETMVCVGVGSTKLAMDGDALARLTTLLGPRGDPIVFGYEGVTIMSRTES